MKTLIYFLFVFIVSFSTTYSLSRIKVVEEKPKDRKEKEGVVLNEPMPTPVPIIRDTPHDPPKRDPKNTYYNPIPPPSRPISPPYNPINTSEPPVVIEFVPVPINDEVPIVEPYDPSPIETQPTTEIDHNYKQWGLSQYKDEDYFNALTSFQLALTKDTLDYSLYYYIGTTEIEIERYGDAVISITKFIDNVIENRLGFYQRGLANFYLGNRDAAFDDFIVADQYKVAEVKPILKMFYDYY